MNEEQMKDQVREVLVTLSACLEKDCFHYKDPVVYAALMTLAISYLKRSDLYKDLIRETISRMELLSKKWECE